VLEDARQAPAPAPDRWLSLGPTQPMAKARLRRIARHRTIRNQLEQGCWAVWRSATDRIEPQNPLPAALALDGQCHTRPLGPRSKTLSRRGVANAAGRPLRGKSPGAIWAPVSLRCPCGEENGGWSATIGGLPPLAQESGPSRVAGQRTAEALQSALGPIRTGPADRRGGPRRSRHSPRTHGDAAMVACGLHRVNRFVPKASTWPWVA